MLIIPYKIEDSSYGIPIAWVERVVPVVEITPARELPDPMLGLVNIHGEVVPVASVRRFLGFPDRVLRLSDRLIVARQSCCVCALLVDSVGEALDIETQPGGSAETGKDEISVQEDGLMQIVDVTALLDMAARAESAPVRENALHA
jgi:purine-binding chemotaxis protein CheW